MKIQVNAFSIDSINHGFAEILQYRKKLNKLCSELPKRLAEFGAVQAQMRFDTGTYDILISGMHSNPKGINVTAEQSENGFVVRANGKTVCFVEFGAGVYYNGWENYRGTRPAGIVGIGQWGKGRGKGEAWAFYDPVTGDLTFTRGTPANNCMWYTAQELAQRVADEARSILSE